MVAKVMSARSDFVPDDLHCAELTSRLIAGALEVHRTLGPGLLESIYKTCLIHELRSRGMKVDTEVVVPVVYKGLRIERGYRADLIVERSIVVELKAVDVLSSLHEAQLLTYMRLCGAKVGLLLNFNAKMLREGLRRMVL